MKLVGEEDAVVDEDMAVAVAAVALIGVLAILITHTATVVPLLVRLLLRKGNLAIPLKGVVMVDLVVHTVEVVVDSVMGKLMTGNALAGCLNVAVEVVAGEYYI